MKYLPIILDQEYNNGIEESNLKYIFNTFPVLLFFDGLDEIFDIQERISVRNDIESFIDKYPKVRVVVTSRYESYTEVKLSEKNFGVYSLLDFNSEQVEDYVKKWYAVEAPLNQKQKGEIEDCLSQLASIDNELKCNPLLLSLILLLYRNELEIPTSKLSIYEGCSNTLVEKRDFKEKKLDIRLKVTNRIAVFASLAYWQFTSENTKRVLPNYDSVKNHIKNYLILKREFIEENDAKDAAEEFLQFAQLRSIYFENKFTHKTFLEYFSAFYIYNFFFTKKKPEFDSIFSDGVGRSSWSVVLELLVCLIDANQLDFDAIDDLIVHQTKLNSADSIILFLHVLKYLNNVSPEKKHILIEQGFELCFKSNQKTKENKNHKQIIFSELASFASHSKIKEIVSSTFKKATENKNIDKKNANVFACEYALVTGDVTLIRILQDRQLEMEDEYLFILSHCPVFYKKTAYLESLQSFIAKFSVDQAEHVYQSQFDQKLFFNTSRFNWINSYIANYIGDSDVQQIYNDLISTGLQKTNLINNVRKHKIEMDMEILKNKLTSIKKTEDHGFNNFVATIRQKHFRPSDPQAKTNFYDRYYIDPKERRV